MSPLALERVSIEVSNRCDKACWFCYNHSNPDSDHGWTVPELLAFVRDCATHGVKAVSFGGGEPLQYAGLFDVLADLHGVVFRSLTSNGLPLTPTTLDRLVAAAPEKVHVSIHFPERVNEVQRVIRQVHELAQRGLRSGINFLVARSKLDAARRAAEVVRSAGISNERIVYLPMRGQDTPAAAEMAQVAGGMPFQSMSCLVRCRRSPRFCSIGWDKTVAWCSYTRTRARLPALSFAGLQEALANLGLTFCGGDDGP
jgi:molybdenum cofactor biosynthesis enzyme MoaA